MLWNQLRELRVRTLANRLYQQDRQRIMERREGLVKAASLVAGSVAIAKLTNEEVRAIAVAVIFVGTACSLVFGWAAKARDAVKRAGEWATLDRDIAQVGERSFTEEQLNAWCARAHELEIGEPPANHAMLELAYRQACLALGREPRHDVRQPWAWVPLRLIP